jgi:hypothetical protein
MGKRSHISSSWKLQRCSSQGMVPLRTDSQLQVSVPPPADPPSSGPSYRLATGAPMGHANSPASITSHSQGQSLASESSRQSRMARRVSSVTRSNSGSVVSSELLELTPSSIASLRCSQLSMALSGEPLQDPSDIPTTFSASSAAPPAVTVPVSDYTLDSPRRVVVAYPPLAPRINPVPLSDSTPICIPQTPIETPLSSSCHSLVNLAGQPSRAPTYQKCQEADMISLANPESVNNLTLSGSKLEPETRSRASLISVSRGQNRLSNIMQEAYARPLEFNVPIPTGWYVLQHLHSENFAGISIPNSGNAVVTAMTDDDSNDVACYQASRPHKVLDKIFH